MTNNEAIETLEEMIKLGDLYKVDIDACEVAIEALKQEPKLRQALEQEKGAYNALVANVHCGDAISRQAALDVINNVEICVSINGYLEIVKRINRLPSVTPKQRAGHWIETADEYYKAVNEYGGGVNEDTPYFTDNIGCSVCLSMFSTIDNETERFNYCPHCGARMESEEQE